MTWRTHVLIPQPPTAAAVFTLPAQAGLYVSVVVANNDAVHTVTDSNANAADGAAMAWLQGMGGTPNAPRSVSRVRCGRNSQNALVLFHFQDVIFLTPAQVQSLSQVPTATIQAALGVLSQGLNQGYQQVLARWLADQTLSWAEVVRDAAYVQGATGLVLPPHF